MHFSFFEFWQMAESLLCFSCQGFRSPPWYVCQCGTKLMCATCIGHRDQERVRMGARFGAGVTECYTQPWNRVELLEKVAMATLPNETVFCDNEGCIERPKLSVFKDHAQVCDYRTVQCCANQCDQQIKHNTLIAHWIDYHNAQHNIVNLAEDKMASLAFRLEAWNNTRPKIWLVDGGLILQLAIRQLPDAFRVSVLNVKQQSPLFGIKFGFYDDDPETSEPIYETGGFLSALEQDVSLVALRRHLEHLKRQQHDNPHLQIWPLKPEARVKISIWPTKKCTRESITGEQ